MDGRPRWMNAVAGAVVLLVTATLGCTSVTAQPGPPAPDAPRGRAAGSESAYGMRYGPGYAPGYLGRYDSVEHDAVANALGMTSEELYAARRSGKSLASLAQERGVDYQALVDMINAIHRDAIEAAAAAGELSRRQADWMLAEHEARIQAEIQGPAWRSLGGPALHARYGTDLLEQAAQALGLSRTEVAGALYDGKSIASLAEERGVDVEQAIIQPLVSGQRAWLQQRSWRLTDAQREEQLTRMEDRLRLRVHTTGAFMDCAPGPLYGPGMGPGRFGLP